jgi:hypothetical protein
MKSGGSDRLLGLTSRAGEPAFRTSEALGEQNRANSTLHFVKSKKHSVDAIDTRRFAAQEVTVVYLSFTNVRISIALPGGSVSLEGGARGTRSRKSRPPT